MPRHDGRKRRVTALVYDVEAYRAVFDAVRQRYPGLEFELKTRESLGADPAALVRELSAPWTPIGVFPINLRELNSLVERGWVRDLKPALPPQTLARYAPTAIELC